MFRSIFLSTGLLFSGISFSQNFTWVRGSSSSSVTGIYGTQGTAAPGNDPGGRHGCSTWTDAQGNMWLFGGEGYGTNSFGWLNDLWKYNPTTNQWTWIRGSNVPDVAGVYGTQGVASPLNEPGAREFCASWTDAAGNFWLYGGDGYAASSTTPGRLADLWKYDPLINQWTWIKGPNTVNAFATYGTIGVAAATNVPGARYWPATWVDNNGKFWVFGGRGYATSNQGRLNDLWRFDPLTNEWTWMKGGSTADLPGVYGTQGVAAGANTPGARDRSSFFKSNQGHLIVFGGQGVPGNPGAGLLNDLWDYDITTGNWTWLKGSTTGNPLTVYGTQGQAAAAVTPGGRASSACWTDMMGNYWVFGGSGIASTLVSGRHNDLFMYNPNTNNWTWIKGSNLQFQNGTYGTMGVTSASSVPGARDHNTYWRNTSTGFLWMIGGEGYDASSNFVDHMNDLWKFKVPCNPDSAIVSAPASVCSGGTVNATAYNLYPSQVYWYSSPTSTTSLGSGSVFTTPVLNSPTTTTVLTFYAGYLPCPNMPMATINVTVRALPQLSVTVPASLCPGQSGTLTASGAQTYVWSNASATASTSIIGNTGPSVLSFTGTGSNGCVSSMSTSVGAYPVPTIGVQSDRAVSCMNETVTLTASGANTFTWNSTDVSTSISVSPTISTTYTIAGTNQFGCNSTRTFTQFVVVCVGLTDQQKAEATRIFPNPNSGNFTLYSESPATVSIADLTGRIIAQLKVQVGTTRVEIPHVPGMYLITLITESGGHQLTKLVVD